MSVFQPPPTYAEVVLYDKTTKDVQTLIKSAKFNPIWLKWFLDLAQNIGGAGGGSVTNVSGVAANGFTWSIANPNSTPALTLALNDVTGTFYTPTLTAMTNVAASTAYRCQYIRSRSSVFVSGQVDIDPTAAGLVQLGISLPIASNLGAPNDCAGTAACAAVAGQSAAILGDAANNRAEIDWIAVDTANRAMYFTFGYLII